MVVNGHSKKTGNCEEGHDRPYAWDRRSNLCHENAVSYAQALERLAEIAEKQKLLLKNRPQRRSRVELPCHEVGDRRNNESRNNCTEGENLPVLEANGRICAVGVQAPCSTPANDTSAMDGFVIASRLTSGASTRNPVKFRIVGTIAAGAVVDRQTLGAGDDQLSSRELLCMEIMTGACFPQRLYPEMDAVVKIEDVIIAEDCTLDDLPPARYIYVSSPVKARQHRRPAGSDFCKGDLIIRKGTRVEPKHVMALTSVGFSIIQVLPEATPALPEANNKNNDFKQALRVGVLPTGSELLNLFEQQESDSERNVSQQKFPDSNGPYITAAVQSTWPAMQVEYMGPCPDDEDSLANAIERAVRVQQYDILVTSGGVSMGRFDLVRKVLSTRFESDVVFHGCLIRPGAPVLCAVVHQHNKGVDRNADGITVVIGAPGNPLAAAATVRFFLRPFLEMLQAPQPCLSEGMVWAATTRAVPIPATIAGHDPGYRKPVKVVAFVLARRHTSQGEGEESASWAELQGDQSSYKIKPFLQSDCWVVAPAGCDKVSTGSELQSYSLW